MLDSNVSCYQILVKRLRYANKTTRCLCFVHLKCNHDAIVISSNEMSTMIKLTNHVERGRGFLVPLKMCNLTSRSFTDTVPICCSLYLFNYLTRPVMKECGHLCRQVRFLFFSPLNSYLFVTFILLVSILH